jgi:hypothetical protein
VGILPEPLKDAAWDHRRGLSNEGKELQQLRLQGELNAKEFSVTQAAIILSGESAKGALNEGQANAAA